MENLHTEAIVPTEEDDLWEYLECEEERTEGEVEEFSPVSEIYVEGSQGNSLIPTTTDERSQRGIRTASSDSELVEMIKSQNKKIPRKNACKGLSKSDPFCTIAILALYFFTGFAIGWWTATAVPDLGPNLNLTSETETGAEEFTAVAQYYAPDEDFPQHAEDQDLRNKVVLEVLDDGGYIITLSNDSKLDVTIKGQTPRNNSNEGISNSDAFFILAALALSAIGGFAIGLGLETDEPIGIRINLNSDRKSVGQNRVHFVEIKDLPVSADVNLSV